jgi:hypothetical protein
LLIIKLGSENMYSMKNRITQTAQNFIQRHPVKTVGFFAGTTSLASGICLQTHHKKESLNHDLEVTQKKLNRSINLGTQDFRAKRELSTFITENLKQDPTFINIEEKVQKILGLSNFKCKVMVEGDGGYIGPLKLSFYFEPINYRDAELIVNLNAMKVFCEKLKSKGIYCEINKPRNDQEYVFSIPYGDRIKFSEVIDEKQMQQQSSTISPRM